MSYRMFNNIVKILNGDLTAKIGQVIQSRDLMDRACHFLNPSKFDGKCVFEGMLWKNYD